MSLTHDTFDDFLMDKFMADNPSIMDDDIADGFDDWICEQDPAMLCQWAEQYSGYRYKQGKIDGLNEASQIIAKL